MAHLIHRAFLLALFIRALILLLPQTFFQPDEYYQALEPAHHFVFGYGHLTWEWRDLPATGKGTLASRLFQEGRLRSWLWPAIFSAVYKVLKLLKLDHTVFLTLAPRLFGVTIAALTDFYTYRLAGRVLGSGASAAALFLSLTSLFNAHLLPRSLSTSPETLLTTIALVYFPLPRLIAPKAVIVGNEDPPAGKASRSAVAMGAKPSEVGVGERSDPQIVSYHGVDDLDYVVMDRMDPKLAEEKQLKDSMFKATLAATTAICIRPTTAPLWAYLGADLVFRQYRYNDLARASSSVVIALTTAVPVLGASILLDYTITGSFYIPNITFVYQNIYQNLSTFYGATSPFYHLTQSLPIMLFPLWWWFAHGFIACLLPVSLLPPSLAHLDRPDGMRSLARAAAFTIVVLSISPHSEWRFLHPLLPFLLLFALPPLFQEYTPDLMASARLAGTIRQYTRLPYTAFWLVVFAPLGPFLYLNTFHGRAQVLAMSILRQGKAGNLTGLAVLMPCHSTPWQSHLHRDIDAWFLTCEPPLLSNGFDHQTQQDLFYASPVSYIEHVFPYPPVPLHLIPTTGGSPHLPSHVMLFGSLLERTDGDPLQPTTVSDALQKRDYEEVWWGWNGFDLAQDEALRRGGVQIWARRDTS